MRYNDHRSDRCDKSALISAYRFDYFHLREKGFAAFSSRSTNLVVTFRGTGMIDVFNSRNWWHLAFLDFDMQREIHLDSAFGSPFIGLPFAAGLKREKGVSLERFDDLRRIHHYGFFVEANYRNNGSAGLWNLDELMMAVALEYAAEHGAQWFRIKPTGDTAPYYRRKYSAMRRPTTSADRIASIRLGSNRKPLPHVRPVRIEGKTRYLDVETGPDSACQSGSCIHGSK